MDYKVLLKVMTHRMRGVVVSCIHGDLTHCVPGWLIRNTVILICDVLELSSSLAVHTGLVAIDQEMTFDWVEHQYLWETLAAFGFSPGFTAMVKAL